MRKTRIVTSYVSAALALTIGVAAASQAAAQELQYWVYSDFAQGDALALQQEFMAEFAKDHPGVKITIAGKGDDDLTAGEVAGAASGTLPDIFMNATSVGAQLVSVGALANIYDKWMALPQDYRDQFDADAIKTCQPRPNEMYCIPYTGFGSLLFRNLTVLEKAGIDTSKAPATWGEWFGQMKQIKDAGFYAVPDESLVFNSIAAIYAMNGNPAEWGIDWDTKTTRISLAAMADTLQKFVDMKPFDTGTSRNNQATKDLFITNQLAYHETGPWVDPTYRQAAADSGLKYDFVLVPGLKNGSHGGIKSYEIIGIAPGPNENIAFQFAVYVAEKKQMFRWAKLLSRYNANAAAMADPEIASLPLISVSAEAVKDAFDTQPPYFVQPVPSCYVSTVIDFASATADGEMTPDEGAKEMIDELNACLQG